MLTNAYTTRKIINWFCGFSEYCYYWVETFFLFFMVVISRNWDRTYFSLQCSISAFIFINWQSLCGRYILCILWNTRMFPTLASLNNTRWFTKQHDIEANSIYYRCNAGYILNRCYKKSRQKLRKFRGKRLKKIYYIFMWHKWKQYHPNSETVNHRILIVS